jgi:hypothetical protein
MKTLISIIRDPDHSKSYITYCLRLAVDLERDVQFLYLQDPSEYPLGTPGSTGASSVQLYQSLEKRAEASRKDLKNTIDRLMESIPQKPLVKVDSDIGSAGLLGDDYITGKDAMIILENLGEGEIWNQASTDLDIIRNVNCPVWIIPPDTVYNPFKEILYATDYNQEDIGTLKRLIELVGKFLPAITALHITEDVDFEEKLKKEGFKEMVASQAGYDRISVKTLDEKSGYDLGLLVNNFAALINADLITVLKENRPFLERLFRQEPTKKIVRQSDVPVLVFHESS